MLLIKNINNTNIVIDKLNNFADVDLINSITTVSGYGQDADGNHYVLTWITSSNNNIPDDWQKPIRVTKII